MTISIKPTASGSTIEQDGSSILSIDASGNLTVPNNMTFSGTVTGISSYADSDALSLFNASGSAPVYAARAWVTYNAQTNTILANGNVSSVTDHATGQFTVNFTTAMPDINYAACGIVGQNDSTAGNHMLCEYSASRTTSSARVVSGTAGNTETDEPYWTYIAFR